MAFGLLLYDIPEFAWKHLVRIGSRIATREVFRIGISAVRDMAKAPGTDRIVETDAQGENESTDIALRKHNG